MRGLRKLEDIPGADEVVEVLWKIDKALNQLRLYWRIPLENSDVKAIREGSSELAILLIEERCPHDSSTRDEEDWVYRCDTCQVEVPDPTGMVPEDGSVRCDSGFRVAGEDDDLRCERYLGHDGDHVSEGLSWD